MVAGGIAPRYVRLRPKASLSAIVKGGDHDAVPDAVSRSVAKLTVEVLTLKPTMSLGLR